MRKGGILRCSIDLALSLQPLDPIPTVELNEQPFAPTLAHKLGDVPHVSGLLRRIAQLSGAGERVAEQYVPQIKALLPFFTQLGKVPQRPSSPLRP